MTANNDESVVELCDPTGRRTLARIYVGSDGAIVVEIETNYEPNDEMRLWINDDCTFIGKPFTEEN